jgi:hypothetical protein
MMAADAATGMNFEEGNFVPVRWTDWLALDIRDGDDCAPIINMDKEQIVQAILERLRVDFETRQTTSKMTRASSNDAETKSEGKYDTRSTEENYLADGPLKPPRHLEISALKSSVRPSRLSLAP